MISILKKLQIIIYLGALLVSMPISSNAQSNIKPFEIAQNDFDDEFDDDEFAEFDNFESSKPQIYDPLETYNRKIYAFNDAFDRYFFEYVARGYRASLPKPIRGSIRNFLTNLSSPISGINSLLQGNVDNALASFSNFLINSTIGLGGFFNVAGKKNIHYTPEDFGQTMGVHGIGPGAYLVIPFFGPSSTRDFGGLVIDRAADPLGMNMFEIAENKKIMEDKYVLSYNLVSVVDRRESLIETIDSIRKDSFDPYAMVRSAYLQRREARVKK